MVCWREGVSNDRDAFPPKDRQAEGNQSFLGQRLQPPAKALPSAADQQAPPSSLASVTLVQVGDIKRLFFTLPCESMEIVLICSVHQDQLVLEDVTRSNSHGQHSS